MRIRSITIVCAVLMTLTAAASAQICRLSYSPALGRWDGTDTLQCDTVRIECPQEITNARPGDSIMIPVYLWFDEPTVPAFSLGFSYNSDMVEIVGVSFANSMVPETGRVYGLFYGRPDENRALVGWVDWTAYNAIPRPTSSHAELLFTMIMQVLPGAKPHAVNLDSVFVAPAGDFALVYDEGFWNTHNVRSPEYVDCGASDIVISSVAEVASCGDVDADDVISISDAVFLLNYVFGLGPTPLDERKGDVTCEGRVNLTDIVWLINYIFAGGLAPCENCSR